MATTQTLPSVLTDWYQSTGAAGATGGAGATGAGGLLTTAAGNTTTNPVTYNPTTLSDPAKWNITKEQTAAGQVENITAKDSPLMQLARTRGLQQSNQRGLLNSSMAVGAAQDSVLNAATPLATFDADINAKSAGYNAETENQFAKANAAVENEAKNFGAQAFNRSNEFNASNEFNKQQSLFEANVKASLQQIDNDAQFDRQSQNIFGGLGQTFSQAIMSINQDPNMDQQSKDYAIKQMFDSYKAQISMLSAVGSIPDVGQLLEAETTPTTPPTAQQTFEQKQAAAQEAAAKEAQRLIASKRSISGKAATDADVQYGYAEYNSVGKPVYTQAFLTQDAAARKAANKAPTKYDVINGFAVKTGTKITWK